MTLTVRVTREQGRALANLAGLTTVSEAKGIEFVPLTTADARQLVDLLRRVGCAVAIDEGARLARQALQAPAEG